MEEGLGALRPLDLGSRRTELQLLQQYERL